MLPAGAAVGAAVVGAAGEDVPHSVARYTLPARPAEAVGCQVLFLIGWFFC